MTRPIPTDPGRLTGADLKALLRFLDYDRWGQWAKDLYPLEALLILWRACGDWDGLDAFSEGDPLGFEAVIEAADAAKARAEAPA